MASQRLETIIAINAQVGNGFAEVGSTLTQLGSLVDGFSQDLMDFGKDSVAVYREYEKSMKDAEVALSTTYGRGTKELSSVMSGLDEAATEWAASTIFHTNDVANAISEASHAGWDYDQIMSGIPAAMQLAEAGSLDLSEAVNYIVKATTAAGVGFEDLGTFTDLWAFAANSSASTIGEFGDAMLRMGSTMRFAADPEELMTLIAVTANAGTVGSEAGTMIRNSIMRLISPTDKAQKAMAELGATSDETAAIMGDEALQTANKRLEAVGFSAYDSNGELKSVLDTYRDLYVALGDVAGGFDDIDKNQDALQILSAIFPTKTITEALTLLRGAQEGYDGLYESMKNGDAEGYGAYAAETMMDTLNGKIEIFGSKLERLKQITGEELSGQVGDFLEGAGDIIDNIANLDEGKFSALVSGLEVVAAAGPAMLTAGAALRGIGLLLTPAGAIGAGVLTITALTTALKELSEASMADNFGSAELDNAAIMGYVDDITEGYRNAYTEVDTFRQAVDDSLTSYQNASSELSSTLLTKMLTNATLSDSDMSTLQNLGTEMHDAVISGIQNSTAASMSYWEILFGGEGEADQSAEYEDIIGATQYAYDEAIAQAEDIGQKLRNAMTDAFADGHISDEEYQNILGYVQSYNEAMAQAAQEVQDHENDVYYEKMLHKAQTASYDELKSISNDIKDKTQTFIQDENDRYEQELAELKVNWKEAAEKGIEFEGGPATEERWNEVEAAAKEKHEQRVLEISEKSDGVTDRLWNSQIEQSGLSELDSQLATLAEHVKNGDISSTEAVATIQDQYGKNNKYAGESGPGSSTSERTQLSEAYAREIDALGGYDQLFAKVADYESKGDTANANALKELFYKQQINDNFAKTGINDYSSLPPWAQGWIKALPWTSDDTVTSTNNDGHGNYDYQAGKTDFDQMNGNPVQQDTSLENVKKTIDAFGDGEGSINSFLKTIEKGVEGEETASSIQRQFSQLADGSQAKLADLMTQLSSTYDFEKIRQDTGGDTEIAQPGSEAGDFFSLWSLLQGEASQNPEKYLLQPEIDDSNMQQDLGPYEVTLQPHMEGEDSISALQDQGVNVQVNGDTQQLQASIDGADGKTLMEYVDGDASNLTMTITDQDGKTLVENVSGDPTDLASQIEEYEGQTVTVSIQGNNMFAEDGSVGNVTATATLEPDDSQMQNIGPYEAQVALQPHIEGEDSMAALQDQGVNVQVNGDTQQLEANIDGADGKTLMEYVDGDATNLSMTITDQDGKILTENVHGDTSALASAIASYNGQTVTVFIKGQKMFAAGGRATSASIFGEAGPEWAIPEEHSERTADLLNAAREASGFTWTDLLTRYGGLNANPNAGTIPTTIIYSPTINAQDATGVEKVLSDDKERLEKWFAEKKMRDEVEVYA